MIKSILKLGMPIILSQGILTLMVLCDRFILSLKNPIFAASATTGGFTAISLSLFFINFLAFATSMIAKRFGENEKSSCHGLVNQTLLLALCFTPLILCLSLFGEKYFTMLGHTGIYKSSEISYFHIILYSQIVCLFRTAIENYYIGTQDASCILKANLWGLMTNALFSYAFVMGPFSSYFEYGSGAAWGTFLSSLLSFVYLVLKYIKDHGIQVFSSSINELFNKADLMELAKQGTYIGLEKFANSFCFVFFVNLFVVYGHEVSTSISTFFSWDQISYLPLLGLYSAVVSIFSRHLGEKNIKLAASSLYASLRMTYLLMLALSILFYFLSDLLTGMFLKGSTSELDVPKVYFYSSIFFKTTCVNVFATATSMLYKAALRSMGHSSWCFIASSLTHGVLCIICYLGVYVYNLNPIHLWAIFLAMMGFLGLLFVFKFNYELKQLKQAEASTSMLNA
jgi:multidrug resistance protein, MATE family